ncbi:MAG: carbamoyltransferase C-terminal domain-containing protein [Candidatus Helarchaeota archaeon]
MKILGINILTHDVSVSLIENEIIHSCLEEERFTRIKHQPGIETGYNGKLQCLEALLKNENLIMEDIDFVALATFPPPIYEEFNVNRYRFEKYIRKKIPPSVPYKIFDHHRSHASSAYRCSNFKEAIILTIDNSGNSVSTAIFKGSDGKITKLKEFPYSQSLGFIYTDACKNILKLGEFGFCEGKGMALSAYGNPQSKFENVIAYDGQQFILNYHLQKKIKKKISHLPLFSKEKLDYIAMLQRELENAIIKCLKEFLVTYKIENICLAGGVALNCKLNSAILKNLKEIKNIFIQPASNDAGLALGAAAELLFEKTGISFLNYQNTYLGTEYSEEQTIKKLEDYKLNFTWTKNSAKFIGEMLSSGKIIGVFIDRMEYGPRALGNRSILASPSSNEIKKRVNYLKNREEWRPLAPSILIENLEEYFFPIQPESPFMTLNFDVKKEQAREIPGVLHIDNTARLQTVEQKENSFFYQIIKEFEKVSGIPMVLNTSFNIGQEPIIESIDSAIQSFYSSNLDILFINGLILEKKR